MVTGSTITPEQIQAVKDQAIIDGNDALIRFCDQAFDDSQPDHQRKAKQFVASAYNQMFPNP